MRDEEYVYFQDLKEKKVTGYSARKQRSHCGKAGCKLPSDYLTKKEIKNMSGECKSYRLNEPMSIVEFRAMPEDLQKTYIMALRQKYNAPVSAIGQMLGIERAHLSKYLREVLGFENFPHGNHSWDKIGFKEWAYGIPKKEETLEEILEDTQGECVEFYDTDEEPVEVIEEETPVTEVPCEPVKEDTPCQDTSGKQSECEPVIQFKKCIPITGSMTYEGLTFNILSSISDLLGNTKVVLSVKWDVVED